MDGVLLVFIFIYVCIYIYISYGGSINGGTPKFLAYRKSMKIPLKCMIWGTPILGKRPSAESHLVGGQGGRRNHRHIVHAQRSEAQLMRCQLTAKICRVQPKRRRFAPIQYDGFVNLIPTNPTIPVYLL